MKELIVGPAGVTPPQDVKNGKQIMINNDRIYLLLILSVFFIRKRPPSFQIIN